MGRDQKDDRHQHIGDRVDGKVTDRKTNPAEPRIDPVDFALQLVEFGNDFLDFEDHRTRYAQIPRAVLARDGFILDGLGAKRTLHQADRRFLRCRSRSSSALPADNFSRRLSRFSISSSRSAISEPGTAMSREQESQTSAFKAF